MYFFWLFEFTIYISDTTTSVEEKPTSMRTRLTEPKITTEIYVSGRYCFIPSKEMLACGITIFKNIFIVFHDFNKSYHIQSQVNLAINLNCQQLTEILEKYLRTHLEPMNFKKIFYVWENQPIEKSANSIMQSIYIRLKMQKNDVYHGWYDSFLISYMLF